MGKKVKSIIEYKQRYAFHAANIFRSFSYIQVYWQIFWFPLHFVLLKITYFKKKTIHYLLFSGITAGISIIK